MNGPSVNGSTEGDAPDRRPRITIYPDGPILVRGSADIVLGDDAPLPHRRRVVAICRCGHSASQPWCDGTHKLVWRPGKDSALLRRRELDEES